MKTLRQQMLDELGDKAMFEQATLYAYQYLDHLEEGRVYPSADDLEELSTFQEPLPDQGTDGKAVLEQLYQQGRKGTVQHTGGRYFGFVNGSALPVTLATKWLSDVWDQCGGLYLTSPINAQLEATCERWLVALFGLPPETIAGFVSGTSMANLCALTAARYHLLQRQGWDINEKGLAGAPPIRIIAHEQVHASIRKTLALLGFGQQQVEWIPSDEQGRLVLDSLPVLDETCMVLLQAGNANTGAFDPISNVCTLANKVGAWVHIDGAFGLWAAASKKLQYLTTDLAQASSWAVDGHKTLNTPYDSGIVLCRHPDAMMTALQASGEYIIYSDKKDPLLTTPELSKRARAIELWAAMKYLGRKGIDELVTTLHLRAQQLAKGVTLAGYELLNEVVFNQVLVGTTSDDRMEEILQIVHNSGTCWAGGSYWQGRRVMRLSVCSWRTSQSDIDQTIAILQQALATTE